ncbi:hypothetical protein SAY87_003198 [Trapa incisa]|uniref:Uncharacterized protein n=1 Tax=Trapa incisa TaxID=236973 RepID=A0AAN7KKI9_9MYRT|nr:hypothetical protein SAY87_003198 [Trapa incisa]
MSRKALEAADDVATLPKGQTINVGSRDDVSAEDDDQQMIIQVGAVELEIEESGKPCNQTAENDKFTLPPTEMSSIHYHLRYDHRHRTTTRVQYYPEPINMSRQIGGGIKAFATPSYTIPVRRLGGRCRQFPSQSSTVDSGSPPPPLNLSLGGVGPYFTASSFPVARPVFFDAFARTEMVNGSLFGDTGADAASPSRKPLLNLNLDLNLPAPEVA